MASAPPNWPLKPRFMIQFPLSVFQTSSKSWPARGWQLRMTKCHMQQINYLSTWTQYTVDVCQLIASSFPMISKGPITWEKLVLGNDGLATSTHSPFHFFSLANLAKEFLYTWYSKLFETLWAKASPNLDGCKMKWPPLMSVLNICPYPQVPLNIHPTLKTGRAGLTPGHCLS